MISPESKLKKVIAKVLEIPERDVTNELAIGGVDKWDSFGHLVLILAIEDEFGVKFLMEKIPELKSVVLISEALKEKLLSKNIIKAMVG